MLVIYVCLKREKNLTLKTCAPDFSARSMSKLYAKIKGAHAISLFDFPKTWQVWISCFEKPFIKSSRNTNINLKLLIIHESCFVFFEKPGVESDQLHITTGCGVIMSPHLLPVLGRYLTDTLVYVNTQCSNLFLQCLKLFNNHRLFISVWPISTEKLNILY